MCYVVVHARCSTVSSAPTYLRVNTVSLNYELFPGYDSELTENTQSVLHCQNVTKFHGTRVPVFVFNVHKAEVRPCLRRFSRNSPSFNKVMWKSHVLNYQNRTQHSRETGIFSTIPLHKIWLSLDRFSRNLPRINGVMWRCSETDFMKSGQELCKETE